MIECVSLAGWCLEGVSEGAGVRWLLQLECHPRINTKHDACVAVFPAVVPGRLPSDPGSKSLKLGGPVDDFVKGAIGFGRGGSESGAKPPAASSNKFLNAKVV